MWRYKESMMSNNILRQESEVRYFDVMVKKKMVWMIDENIIALNKNLTLLKKIVEAITTKHKCYPHCLYMQLLVSLQWTLNLLASIFSTAKEL